MTTQTLGDPAGAELSMLLRTLKLDNLLDSLPERLTLADQQHLPHADFLRLLLADEAARRGTESAEQRVRKSGLDPRMRIDTWDSTSAVHYDQQLWAELTSLRLIDDPRGAVILGPTGVGKTHLATALGHLAHHRRRSVLMARTDKLLKQLKAARLDNTIDAKMRRLTQVDLLILDDFALRPLDATETTDIYELIVERHDRTATVIISNREPTEWRAMMAEPLLARSAVDRLVSAAHELVIEGNSYRRRLKPGSGAGHHPPAPVGPPPGSALLARAPTTLAGRGPTPAEFVEDAELVADTASAQGTVPARSDPALGTGATGGAVRSATVAERPAELNGSVAAALISAGIGSAVFGALVLSGEASTAIKSSLTLNTGVGSLSGKSLIGGVAFLITWLILHLILREREVNMRLAWWLTAVPLAIGLAFTFPPLFQLAAH